MTASGAGSALPPLVVREPQRDRAARQPGGTLRAVIESFGYEPGGRPVLADIDLSVRTGELVVVAGPSGSGKSTLAAALAGLIPQRIGGIFRGRVTWEEPGGRPVDLTSLPLHEAAQHVGITFQNPEYQLIQYQVDAEVAFGPENLGLPHDEVVARVHQALDLTGIRALASAGIATLSGGQKQRVAIAAALAMAPPMLVLDEPTSDLDPVGTGEVLAVLHRLSHQSGRGVVVVEHKLDEAARYADRVVLLVDGRVVLDDHPRRAFMPTDRWRLAGVRPPELVSIAEELPGWFGSDVPLTVDEAAAHLEGRQLGRLQPSPAPDQSAGGCPAAGPGPGVGHDASSAFEAAGLSVLFKGQPALREVSIRVAVGEWVAVVGANGSGKSTLAATLMGFVPPDSGTVRCFGRPVRPGRIPPQAELAGYLFQNVDDMLFSETVAAELRFTATHRLPAASEAPVPEQIAALIGLAQRMDAHPYAISGGERQRLALGALLTRAPRGLILDEPTTGLDEAHATALFDLLASVRTSLGELTCLLITHDMRLVARFADRVIALRDGAVVLDDTPRRAFAQPELLLSCGVLPPPVSVLHCLLDAEAGEVALNPAELLALLGPGATHGGGHVARA
jgi:energy-coupling factor transporter ATP-binding protein EcfA2